MTRSPWLSVSILTIVLGSPALADPLFLSTRGATDSIVMPSRPGGGPGSGVNEETEATDGDILSAYDALGYPAKASEMWSQLESRLKRKLAPGHIAFAALALEQSLTAEDRRDLPSAMDLANQAVAIPALRYSCGGLAITRSVVDYLVRHQATETNVFA